MGIKLTVESGPHQGLAFEFVDHDRFIVGRSARAQFRLPLKDKALSRIHFMVEVNPPDCRLVDLGSTNGTKVNGTKVPSAALREGDVIEAGETVLRVSITAEGAPASTPPTHAPAPAPAADPGATIGTDEMATAAKGSHAPIRTAAFASRGDSCPACGTATALPSATEAEPEGESVTVALGRAPRSAASPTLCAPCSDRASENPQPIPGYVLLRELGRGGMGVVYLALRRADASLSALKMIKPAVVSDRVTTERFLREASILNALDHPNIVPFRETGEVDGLLYFAMEYVAGSDASRLQKEHGGPMPIPRAVGWICQLLQALEYAHAKGFVHRDLKPANMLIHAENGRETVKLSDFGLSRAYQTSRISGLTVDGDVAGTMAFMAPEQVLHLREARPPVDQYAAAASLYKLLTDTCPYDLPRRLDQQILMILETDPVPIARRRPDIPTELEAIVHRALARDPERRFPGVLELRRALLPFARPA